MCNKNAWVGDNIFVGDLSQFKILQKTVSKEADSRWYHGAIDQYHRIYETNFIF